MIQKNKLYGIVVWYNPSEENLQATESYINDVHCLIIVDNSNSDNSSLIKQKGWRNLIYIPNYTNRGIATALNQGCKLALEQEAEWVLTMDQDSSFDKKGLSNLIEYANQYSDFTHTAIFSARHYIEDEKKAIKKKALYTLEENVMTSGNLLSLKAFQTIGRFADSLFIDMVDLEYCIRIKAHDFNIVMINDVILHHFMGRGTIERSFGFIRKSFYNHTPIRKYYIARNSLYVAMWHHDYKNKYRIYLIKQIKKVILYDNHDKWKKLRYMLKGIIDYKKGITGIYPHGE